MSYPECEKLLAVRDKSSAISEFLEWCEENSIVLRQWRNDEFCPEMLGRSHEELLAEYFGIDLKKVEVERREMLAALPG